MVELWQISDEEIQEYLDGRLTPVLRAKVAAYLRATPSKAAEVEAMRLQDGQLRYLGRWILEEPIPERLLKALGASKSFW